MQMQILRLIDNLEWQDVIMQIKTTFWHEDKSLFFETDLRGYDMSDLKSNLSSF